MAAFWGRCVVEHEHIGKKAPLMPTIASPLPVAAPLAVGPAGLVKFAQVAGKNLLRVIPEETLRVPYLKGPGNIHWVMDPDAITEMLIPRAKAFPKSVFTKNIIGSAVGKGMILAEGEAWREQRRRYAPLFAARHLPMVSEVFARTGMEMAGRLVAHPGRVDMGEAIQEATLSDISQIMFSGSGVVDPAVVREGLRRYTAYISHVSLFDLMGLPKWLPRRGWLRSSVPVTSMRALARQVIEGRRALKRAEPEDFLDLMIAALDADKEDIETTVDNLLTFVVAGHETAANTMAWGFYLNALFPKMQDRIRAEIRAVRPSGPLRLEDIERMPLLSAHVNETLRLYPAAAFSARDATEDSEVGPYRFKKGDAIFLPFYILHRHELWWEEPGAYKPERFLGEKPRRGQFLPFGDGPRICIGAPYSEAEMRILVGSVLRDVRLSLTGDALPEPVLTFTMRPSGPMWLRAEPA